MGEVYHFLPHSSIFTIFNYAFLFIFVILFSMKNAKMLFILITMFLNFLGFSIIIPILPFLVGKYVHTSNAIALYVGLLLSAYSFCQFLAAPGLGALSDRFGRRPILLFSLFGSVIGYLFLGIGGALWILFLGRIIDGLTGGNISTIFAYVADITAPQDRGKYYGMLGAAGGFGFMVGPALGGILAHISLATPLFAAAAVTLLNMVWGYFVLPESLPAHHKIPKIDVMHLNPLAQFNHIFSLQILRRLFLSGFIFFFAMTAMYGNASVYLKDVFHWSVTQIGLLLFIVGILDVISQGFLVRKLLPVFGEAKLSAIGLALCVAGFAIGSLTAIFTLPLLLYGGVILINIGDGLYEPSASGLISGSVGPKMQGRVQGANQGMQSVARVVGPLFSAWTYQYWHGLPYALESVITLVSFAILIASFPIIHKIVIHD
jgi:DHA1 family tetracycline resistance protein-like MFS transporter